MLTSSATGTERAAVPTDAGPSDSLGIGGGTFAAMAGNVLGGNENGDFTQTAGEALEDGAVAGAVANGTEADAGKLSVGNGELNEVPKMLRGYGTLSPLACACGASKGNTGLPWTAGVSVTTGAAVAGARTDDAGWS